MAAQTVKPERAVAACSTRRQNEHLIGQLLTRRLVRNKMYGFASPCETLANEWVLITLREGWAEQNRHTAHKRL